MSFNDDDNKLSIFERIFISQIIFGLILKSVTSYCEIKTLSPKMLIVSVLHIALDK